jgi:hypothetical protein
MLSLLLAAAAAPVPACPIDRAVYRLNGAPEYTAGFAPQERRNRQVSDLVLWLKTPKRTYWFSFGSPNGYGGTYIAPALDPGPLAAMSDDDMYAALDKLEEGEPVTIMFDAFGPDLRTLAVPQSTDPAPALLFARGIGPALWYEPNSLAAGGEAEQESMPIGLFQPAGCADSPLP